ncbi:MULTISPECIES: NYN domain-containing protein [Halomonadaceae]|uniref:NYN domain-containing protein n=1 Tax=Vreelandella halophila TaxID=86177 RepID=A0A9X5B624_9GAMM|nr:NYN domain-containing protein [uncultured Halovibrio sp.]MYL27955.1 NYN domain-containing protein [Halomonas utahensis]MYL75590.1 NYN domain-containing protein [Halomonas sp. 22501_18_FS]
MAENDNDRLAVMIDADNAQASLCPELLAEVARFGVASVKRAYGDWTTTNLKGWKEHLHKHAIQPVQQFSYTTGKNATDSALIIDAMDLLHEGKLDGFCLVSSDSDFTRLATRIRESGLTVYGFGERKTPEPFVSACDKFIYTEILKNRTDVDEPQPVDAEQTSDLRDILIPAVNTVSKDDGWAPLSGVGDYLNKKYPSFDSRNYGYQKLGQLMKSLDYISVDERRPQPDSPITHIFVKATA